jgi:TonB family protein
MKSLIGILLILVGGNLFAQQTSDTAFRVVRPHLNGGDSALYAFLNAQFDFPNNVSEEGFRDTITIGFTVDSAGKIKNHWAANEKKNNTTMDSVAIRAIRKFPSWLPGTINGVKQEVSVTYQIRINIPAGGRDTFQLRPRNVTIFEEAMPIFPGGNGEFAAYLRENIKYPAREHKKHIGGVVYVFFKVNKDGSISDVKTSKGVPGAPALSTEAERVVAGMPNWYPGCMNGRRVIVGMTIPIRFTP